MSSKIRFLQKIVPSLQLQTFDLYHCQLESAYKCSLLPYLVGLDKFGPGIDVPKSFKDHELLSEVHSGDSWHVFLQLTAEVLFRDLVVPYGNVVVLSLLSVSCGDDPEERELTLAKGFELSSLADSFGVECYHARGVLRSVLNHVVDQFACVCNTCVGQARVRVERKRTYICSISLLGQLSILLSQKRVLMCSYLGWQVCAGIGKAILHVVGKQDGRGFLPKLRL